ncbi:hypothetical protein F5X97DRAFT_343486 [Nemania serpens]|nr:hypothetical protein F5X97DRAFT_343486 [Nemania serpens]
MDDSLPLPRTLALNASKNAIEEVELALSALHILPRGAHAAAGSEEAAAAQSRVPLPGDEEERAFMGRCAGMVRAHLGLQSRFASAEDVELSSRALTGPGFAKRLARALGEICAALEACAARLEANAARLEARAARGFRDRRGRLRGAGYVGAARGRTSSLRMVVRAPERGLSEILDAAVNETEAVS